MGCHGRDREGGRTVARMVCGEEGGGCSRLASSFLQRTAISARRAAISAVHEVCFNGGGWGAGVLTVLEWDGLA